MCKENSKTCVVKISCRKFKDIKSFLLYSFCFLIFVLKIEGSQLASGDPVGLSKSENERVAFAETSPNISGFCDENANKVNYLLFM